MKAKAPLATWRPKRPTGWKISDTNSTRTTTGKNEISQDRREPWGLDQSGGSLGNIPVPKDHPSEGQLRPSTTLVSLGQNAAVSEYQ
jgi:hypothetical protein